MVHGTGQRDRMPGLNETDSERNMFKYIIKRILLLIPILLGVSAIIFILKTVTPGDPARQILGNTATEEQVQEKREELGLNDPVIVQYVRYIGNIVTKGDFGNS
jgi:peptide/nickel transport system permease protein